MSTTLASKHIIVREGARQLLIGFVRSIIARANWPTCRAHMERAEMIEQPLVFIHLSDIHFKHRHNGGTYDLDLDLRNELERDVVQLSRSLGTVTGLLVTGDIAYSGTTAEYDEASAWLSRLCGFVGCPPEDVWLVPGNHDVDRQAVRASPTLRMYHKQLRTCGLELIDKTLEDLLNVDDIAKELMFLPLAHYNAFAAKFECSVSARQPYWQAAFNMNDGSTLRIRGLSSTIISDAEDDDGANKLVLGRFQSFLAREDGVQYLTLCHHPPSWLRDADSVQEGLNSRACIQLFGHKHSHRIEQINSSLRLAAGAVHPEREGQHWEPRYNAIVVRVVGSDQHRALEVTIYPRVWNRTATRFAPDFDPDGHDSYRCSLELPPWSRAKPEQASAVEAVNAPADAYAEKSASPESQTSHGVQNRNRRLSYRFSSLPYYSRVEIARALDLLEDADRDVDDRELFVRVFRRAAERRVLARLWDEVEHRHTEGGTTENPFKERTQS